MNQIINFELKPDNSIEISVNKDVKIRIHEKEKQITSKEIFESLNFEIGNKYEITVINDDQSILNGEQKKAYKIMLEVKNLYEEIIKQINAIELEIPASYDDIHMNDKNEEITSKNENNS